MKEQAIDILNRLFSGIDEKDVEFILSTFEEEKRGEVNKMIYSGNPFVVQEFWRLLIDKWLKQFNILEVKDKYYKTITYA